MPVYALGDIEPRIDPTAYVHPEAVVIGNVEIGPESSVWPNAVIRGDDNLISIGARTSVQDNAVLHCADGFPTIIGDDVTLGHLCHLIVSISNWWFPVRNFIRVLRMKGEIASSRGRDDCQSGSNFRIQSYLERATLCFILSLS